VILATAGCGKPLQPTPAGGVSDASLAAGELAGPLRTLADVRLGGRMTGTKGNLVAGEYIASQFKAAGLEPGGDGGYFQAFPVKKIRVPAPRCFLRTGKTKWRLGEDFYPIAAGAKGAFNGPLVFAGYGLDNKVRRYNDYAGLSVAGAVVMILQGEPHDAKGQSRWALKGQWTRLAGLKYKLRQARRAGAVGVLIVTPPDISPDIDPLYNVLPGKGEGFLPTMRISRQTADALLAEGKSRKTIARLVNGIHASKRPHSFPMGLTISGLVETRPGSGRNVVGILRAGKPERNRPVIVIGAHYDHLPVMGYRKARDKGFGVRPGADDNASGTAVLIQLAKALGKMPRRNCDYVLIAFSGEEIGFLGSKYYVKHPAMPLKRTAVMINLDQVGHLRKRRVLVIGSGAAEPFSRILTDANNLTARLKIVRVPIKNWAFWSDNAPFVAMGIETLFFFTGYDEYYHRKTDTIEHVNIPGMAKVARLVFDTIRVADQYFAP
ncbi:MAG: M28 family peptidase, partial [Phycisphaerae bacterium]|nr:M28 family peptidase [Phycisphaerae bacterium]